MKRSTNRLGEIRNLHLYRVMYSYPAENRRANGHKYVATTSVVEAAKIVEAINENYRVWNVNHAGQIDIVDQDAPQEVTAELKCEVARSLARGSATYVIQRHSVGGVIMGGRTWYKLPMDDGDVQGAELKDAVKYLALQGLLDTYPEDDSMISIVGEETT